MPSPLTRFVPLLLAMPLCAQGLLIQPVGPAPAPIVQPDGRQVVPMPQVRLVRSAVHAEIVDGVATTTIDQVFRNDGGRDAEGTWFLPLPLGAVADGFTMTVGGKEIRGEVLDAGQARAVYESIVRQRRDPGLLEYAGEGLLRARIFPIPAQGEVGVTVRFRQVLQPTGGLYEWQWPLRAARHADAGEGPLALDVTIKSQTPIRTVVAPYSGAEIRRPSDREAVVTLEGRSTDFQDLKVLYGLSDQEFGLHLLAYRQAGEPGWFTMLVSPPRALPADRQSPRRFVQLVVDTSGSMKGAKILQARAAVRAFLRSLRPDDVFQVVTFASAVQTFFDRPMPASPENLQAAEVRVDRLEAVGGTNISGALEQALAAAPPTAADGGSYLPQIVFVTDGQPTIGLTQPNLILDLTRAADQRATRLFALGVGDDIDVRLIDDLVQQHRGARDFVRNEEKIEAKVDALCQKLAQPALTDVEVRCDGLDAFDVHPTRMRDLFCGELLQVSGRYRDSGKRNVRIRGKQLGVEREFVFPVEFPAESLQHGFVQTLWARQHIGALLDGIRRNGPNAELVGEVRALATRYGIVTPYTSQLIVEEGMRLAGQPAPRPRGGLDAGGPAGPATGGPTGPAGSAPQPGESAFDSNQWNSAVGLGGGAGGRYGGSGGFARLGLFRTGSEAIVESLEVSGDDFFLGRSSRQDGAAAKAADARGGLVKRASGRSFMVVGTDLVEQGLPADWAKQAVVVEAFSAAYFELLKQKPNLREVLALGERVVFRDGDRIVHVKPADPAPEAKPAPAEPAKVPAGKTEPGK